MKNIIFTLAIVLALFVTACTAPPDDLDRVAIEDPRDSTETVAPSSDGLTKVSADLNFEFI